MSHLLQKCTVCGSLVDEDDLFCSNCGTEAAHDEGSSKGSTDSHQISVYSFGCDSCGASMSYDASSQALRCPFCGSEKLSSQKESRTLKPTGVVPFQFDENRAVSLLREWLSSGFWKASAAATESAVKQLTNVYVPFWIFSVQTSTRWTGDSSRTPAGARGDWYPLSGTHASSYRDLLIIASSTLTPNEVDSISPFSSSQAIPPNSIDLTNVIVEEFRMPRKYARPIVRGRIEMLETQACRGYIPGSSRNVKVNVRISNLESHPILLPIWIMVYRFKDKPYRVLINGQTGKVSGESPFAYGKLAVILLVIALIVAAIAAVAILANVKNF